MNPFRLTARSNALRSACAMAAEHARFVWGELGGDQRSELQRLHGHAPAHDDYDTCAVQRQLLSVGLVSNQWQASAWGSFVYAVGGAR